MGQLLGKAEYLEDFRPFANLSEHILDELWQNFNEIAEGFGISLDEVFRICSIGELSQKFEKFDEAVGNMFKLFDTDENGLIDSLEFLTTLAFTSGLENRSIVGQMSKSKFLFRAYDFDESGELSFDEIALALKSCVVGLGKASGTDPISDESLEGFVQLLFNSAEKDKSNGMSFYEFEHYLIDNAESSSWVFHFNDVMDDSPIGEPILNEYLEKPESTAQNCVAAYRGNWKDVVAHTVPSDPPFANSDIPDMYLEPKWIFGYSARSCRSSLWYNINGSIVFPAASLGVIFSGENASQKFFHFHHTNITACELHPNARFVGTAEQDGVVAIWDSTKFSGDSFQTLSVLSVPGNNIPTNISFSPDGTKVAIVAKDCMDEYFLYIYEWSSRKELFSVRVGNREVFDSCFQNDFSVVIVGDGFVNFWDLRSLETKSGVFSRQPNVFKQRILSVVSLSEKTVITGTDSGHLYYWEGFNCVKALRAHQTAVFSINTCGSGFLSGGSDGRVRLWTNQLEAKANFDVRSMGVQCHAVSSISMDESSGKVLVGTMGSEILELNSVDGSSLHDGPLFKGHFGGSVNAITINSSGSTLASVGDDGFLRVWDLPSHKEIKKLELHAPAQTVCFSPNERMLCVGLGGDVCQNQKMNGCFQVLNYEDLSLLHEARDSKQRITEMKFSPDGFTLGVSSADGRIFLYDVESDFAAKAKCPKHDGSVLCFDFSTDSSRIQSCDSKGELNFFVVETGEQIKSASAMRDVEWAQWSSLYGWPVQGIYPDHHDPLITTIQLSRSGKVFIVGDELGEIRCVRNPCLDINACFQRSNVHGSTIRSAQWGNGDSSLITCSSDGCVIEWNCLWSGNGESEDLEPTPDIPIFEFSKPQAALMDRDNRKELFKLETQMQSTDVRPMRGWECSMVEPTEPLGHEENSVGKDLALEWVYGFASDHTNNLFHLKSGNIIYFASKVAIVFNHVNWQQTFMMEHTNAISCLSVAKDGITVATSQHGMSSKILVWDSSTLKVKWKIVGDFVQDVQQLAFSPDGKFLAAVMGDCKHELCIFDLVNNRLHSRSPTSKRQSNDIAWNSHSDCVSQVGNGFILFHQIKGPNISTIVGRVGRKGKSGKNSFLCVQYFGSKCVVGTLDGHLYSFINGELHQSVKAHAKNLDVMSQHLDLLATGGKDGKIRLFNSGLELQREFVLTESMVPAVRSVCLDAARQRILVGTAGAEILEISSVDGSDLHGSALLEAHYSDELWGLACNSSKPDQFCTVGDDRTIRMWDSVSRKMTKIGELPGIARTVDYSVDGDFVCIGFGGSLSRGKQTEDGRWQVIQTSDLQVVKDEKSSKQAISDVKFSPDGSTLAVGCFDSSVYLFDVRDEYERKGIFDKATGLVRHLDFSVDGRYLQVGTAGHELLYCECSGGKHIKSAASLRDETWHTLTTPMGWSVKEIYNGLFLEQDISCLCRSAKQDLVVFGDKYGCLHLRPFPADVRSSWTKHYDLHDNVTNSRWMHNNTRLITLGADRCILQWRLVEESSPEFMQVPYVNDEDCIETPLKTVRAEPASLSEPWRGSIAAPMSYPQPNPTKPKIKLSLGWVYGYSNPTHSSNIGYNTREEIIYPAANTIVCFNKQRHTQNYYFGHDENVSALAIDPTRRYVATGQIQNHCEIHVWDSSTAQLLCKLPCQHVGAVLQLAFSKNGESLVSVGQDSHHSISLWSSSNGSWTDGRHIASSDTSSEKPMMVSFCENEFLCCVGGVNFIKFFKLSGNKLLSSPAIYQRRGKLQPFLSSTQLHRRFLTGCLNGHIYVWEGNTVVNVLTVHNSPVSAMCSCPLGFVSADRAGVVKIWSHECDVLHSFDLKSTLDLVLHSEEIISLAFNDLHSAVLVGTKGGELLEITIDSGHVVHLVQGHFKNTLCGITAHPKKANIVVTVGDDATLRVWDIFRKKMVRLLNLDTLCRSVAFSPNGKYICIGLGGSIGDESETSKKDGTHMILHSDTLETVHVGRDSKKFITDIKFSPNGKLMAICGADCSVVIYETKSWNPSVKFEEHTAPVSHCDFSHDSMKLRMATSSGELVYCNAISGERMTEIEIRADEWDSYSCTFGWHVQGVWPAVSDGTIIQATSLSHDGKILATGSNFGDIRLYNFPTIDATSSYVQSKAVHASDARNITWNCTDNRLLSVGGLDRCVFVFDVCPIK